MHLVRRYRLRAGMESATMVCSLPAEDTEQGDDMKTCWITRLTALLALAVLSACGSQPASITGADRDAVLAYSEAMTDNLLQGFNASDYAAFSRDFDDAMKGGIPAGDFAGMRTQIVGKIGQYVSRQVADVFELQGNIAVNYTAKFEQEDAVSVRVVFSKAEPHKVTGLWFNSPKLAGK